METTELLRRVPVFHGLSSDELDAVSSLAEDRRYSANQVIFGERTGGREMYVLVKGRVRIELGIRGKTDCATVHRVGEEELFGELALLSRGRRSATARCETDSEAIAISRDALLDLFNRDNHIGYVVAMNLASILATRLRKTNLQLVSCFLWE